MTSSEFILHFTSIFVGQERSGAAEYIGFMTDDLKFNKINKFERFNKDRTKATFTSGAASDFSK